MPLPPYIDIGRRLEAIRKAVGNENQQEFALRIGLAKNTYNEYELGKRKITLEPATVIRNKHGIPLDWIYFEALEDKLPADILEKIRQQRPAAARRKRPNGT